MERFTMDQIREYHDAFCLFDKSDTGYVPASELRELLKTIGMNPTDEVLEQMIVVIDLDGNGMIDFDEFMDLIDKVETEEKNDKDTLEAFNAFDDGARGYILAEDIKAVIMTVNDDHLTPKDKEEIIKLFKLDNGRYVYYDEFKKMITLKRLTEDGKGYCEKEE